MGESKDPPPTIYFGYGSNLWLAQMTLRCATSTYLGTARLRGYKWIINERGYANVVQTGTQPSAAAESAEFHDYTNEVWGLVYSLLPNDEAKLDVNEGVPEAYTKEYIPVDFWAQPLPSSQQPQAVQHQEGSRSVLLRQPKQVSMLVYIDRLRTEPAEPRKEYVVRMNKGICDAVEQGVPEGYVRGVLRGFIPEGGAEGEGEIEVLARRQAARFEDESGVC
ncbi:hypothetical protein BDY17DRAFT_308595 [Neohortaea acidophila]|uniref:gamma-glutamylcyclotransferase n=1 Tax=Neohortaea acidophila TaxID=245834 RepID=A0A6A6PY73_9PEZI|nr:uncharacterized protein BDY17DRAFT_308595 [Neohortaea acidophila]KAF2485148.1 hypothetical protein BDY17DRAFT_308595 [Neohortaea acidophila]